MPQAADEMINLGFLTHSEQLMILEVLRRDEELRQAEERRVRKLKTELLDVKRKGAKRGSGKYSQHTCGRCQEPLSRLAVLSSQCKMCNHYVCGSCREIWPNGSWLCSVCAKESELKKSAGDWFYNQRVNRFSTMSGHELVRSSLKQRPTLKQTAGQILLKNAVLSQAQPTPVPRQRNSTANKNLSSGFLASITSRESFESKEDVSLHRACSDTESTEITSLTSSKADTASGHVSPYLSRRKTSSVRSSHSASSVSSTTGQVKADTDSSSSSSEADHAPEVKQVSPSPQFDVDRLFKKSIKRASQPPECVSTLDLRDGPEIIEASLSNRSHSVPVLDVQEDEVLEEEEEDIDSLVSFHRRSMAASSSSLKSSKSTLGSLMSIYSEAGDYDSVEVRGDITFSMIYDEHTQSLQVFIKECHGLAFGDASRQLCNPYVKCYLLPDKSRQSKRKTSIKRNTTDPIYKETLKYSISRSQIFTRSVLISVWHYGRLSRNAFLGEVEVPLDCHDLDSKLEERVSLMTKAPSAVPTSAFTPYKGELVISLKFIPPKTPKAEERKGKKAMTDGGELHVHIKEAKNLMAMKAGGTSDSFVKGYLFPTKSKSMKRKTPVVKKNLTPHYDHTFVYKELALEQLKVMCLELTAWDREAMLSNEFLGGVRLSSGRGTVKIGKEEVEMDSVGEEVSLWMKMLQYPDSWAEGTLPLRSTMGKNKSK